MATGERISALERQVLPVEDAFYTAGQMLVYK